MFSILNYIFLAGVVSNFVYYIETIFYKKICSLSKCPTVHVRVSSCNMSPVRLLLRLRLVVAVTVTGSRRDRDWSAAPQPSTMVPPRCRRRHYHRGTVVATIVAAVPAPEARRFYRRDQRRFGGIRRTAHPLPLTKTTASDARQQQPAAVRSLPRLQHQQQQQ